jgi:hypothetical protein
MKLPVAEGERGIEEERSTGKDRFRRIASSLSADRSVFCEQDAHRWEGRRERYQVREGLLDDIGEEIGDDLMNELGEC